VNHWSAILAVLTLLATSACQGRVVPLSAQRGSTVLIPLNGAFADPATAIGYGGATYADHQRGEMVFKIDSPTGVELVTRATTAVLPHPASRHARNGAGASPGLSGFQHVSLVDIPTGAPLGRHDLYLVRRDASGEQNLGLLRASIEILPESVLAGTETITGAPTPFRGWPCLFCGSGAQNVAAEIPLLVPDPQIEIRLDASVWAVELAIDYPADVIDVVDVIHVPYRGTGVPMVSGDAAVAWVEDPGVQTGIATARVSAASAEAAFEHLAVVFTLDDGASQILDLNDVAVTVTAAYDDQGSAVPGLGIAALDIR
jgi:hypothetical protein